MKRVLESLGNTETQETATSYLQYVRTNRHFLQNDRLWPRSKVASLPHAVHRPGWLIRLRETRAWTSASFVGKWLRAFVLSKERPGKFASSDPYALALLPVSEISIFRLCGMPMDSRSRPRNDSNKVSA